MASGFRFFFFAIMLAERIPPMCMEAACRHSFFSFVETGMIHVYLTLKVRVCGSFAPFSCQ
jgi:hypothetical protein